MNVKLPYGKEFMSVDIADENLLGVYWPNEIEKADYKNILKTVLEEKGFEDFINAKERLVFVVNDGTRPTPTAKILQGIYPAVREKDIQFLVATGAHRTPTEQEYHYIFGKDVYDELVKKDAVLAHDARRDETVYFGKSKNGTELFINKIVAEAKKVVVIGSVEPHYFAGYTGGRKAFVPGVASFETIEQNHKLALSPNAKALSLEGNPVNEDMMEAAGMLNNMDVFAIMTVLDRDGDIYAITGGDLEESFYEAVEKANEVFCVDVPEKADIVISAAFYPMDVNLYQSHKAIEAGKLALKEGGILIMVSKCRDGIGERAFYELLAGEKSPCAVLEKVEGAYKLGYHKACKILETSRWAQIWAVTELPDETIEAVHMKPYHNLETALREALKEKGEDAKVIVLPCGSVTVPRVKR